MRAVAIKSFGGPERLLQVEIPVPEPMAGQVRLRVTAAAVNQADLAARSGAMAALLPKRDQYILGWDVAGTVDALGEGVTDFSLGDTLIGMSDWLRTLNGMQAEFAVLDSEALAPAPRGIPTSAAATIPANGLTALQSLDLLSLSSGQRLVITGAGGAVGGYAVELARQRGIEVIGVGAARDAAFIEGLGAIFVARSIDPVAAIMDIAPAGVDAILDTAVIGQPLLRAVRDGGCFVAVIPPAAPLPERRISVKSVGVQSNGRQLRELATLAERGLLTLRVAHSLPFAEAARAHDLIAAGGIRGRYVLIP